MSGQISQTLGLKIPTLNCNSRQLLLLTVKPVLSRHPALYSANSTLRWQTLFPIFTVTTVTRKWVTSQYMCTCTVNKDAILFRALYSDTKRQNKNKYWWKIKNYHLLSPSVSKKLSIGIYLRNVIFFEWIWLQLSHWRFKPNYLSEGSVSTSPILLTISIPPDTLPNTVCLPARNDKMSTIKWSCFVQNVSKAFSRNRQVIFPKKTNIYMDQLN